MKKTKAIFGACIYSGKETKLALNSKIKSVKFSNVEKSLNTFFIVYFSIVVAETVVSTVCTYFLGKDFLRDSELEQGQVRGDTEYHWYFFNYVKEASKVDFDSVVLSLLAWLLIYNYLIPISLYCSVEFQKFMTSFLFGWDLKMYDHDKDIPAKCSNSDIPEDLGLITHIFSDKTGTLTKNEMELKYINIEDKTFTAEEMGKIGWCLFTQVLLICHTVEVLHDGKITAESPDEEAIILSCMRNNFYLVENTTSTIVVKHKKKTYTFNKLYVLEFDSFRKRMSVIVRSTDTKQVFMFTKGADSSMAKIGSSKYLKNIENAVDAFSRGGYRTLVLGYKQLNRKDLEQFIKGVNAAHNDLVNRETALLEVYNNIETNITLIGSTGIEDKLQDEVHGTITALREASLHIWMLTGDKKETAMAIAKSAGLVGENCTWVDLTKKSNDEMEETMDSFFEKRDLKNKCKTDQLVLFVDGHAVGYLMKYEDTKEKLYQITKYCHTVIATRLSPIQKSQVIRVIKERSRDAVTLAIGDGGNDVSMIQEAHVGIGIHGREGSAAVRAADFTLGKFKFLRRTLMGHGFWNYHRLSYLVQYSFYKNVTMFTCQLYYAYQSNFSAINLYDSLFLVFFNLIYTSMPIVAFGIAEQHYSMGKLIANSALYHKHKGNKLLNMKSLSLWILLGVYQSAVVFYGTYILWPSMEMHGLDKSAFGLMIAGSLIVATMIKLLLDSKFWNVLFQVTLLLSLAIFVSVTLLISEFNVNSTDYAYKSYSKLIITFNLWLSTPVLVMAAVLPNLTFLAIENIEVLRRLFCCIENRTFNKIMACL